jgi:hypothetical protein
VTNWAPFSSTTYDIGGVSTASSYGQPAVAAFMAHTKGSWTTVAFSSTLPSHGFWFGINRISAIIVGGPARVLMDIGIQQSGTDVVLVPNFLFHTPQVGSGLSQIVYCPIKVDAGSTVRARIQSDQSVFQYVPSCEVIFLKSQHGFRNYPLCTTSYGYGITTGSSSGTTIDPGGTANTKGSWTQITASTSAPMRWLIVNVSMLNATAANAAWRVDVGVGGSGSEVVVIPDLLFQATTKSDNIYPSSYTCPIYLPAGVRLAVRAQSTNTTAADRVFEAGLIGLV